MLNVFYEIQVQHLDIQLWQQDRHIYTNIYNPIINWSYLHVIYCIRNTCIVYPLDNYYHDCKHRTRTRSEALASQAWLTTYVHGQCPQLSFLLSGPSQSFPPLAGTGLLHFLTNNWAPPPQGTEQFDALNHGDHPPSTAL